MNRGYPGRFEIAQASGIMRKQFGELRLHVRGRLLGEGDGENMAGVEAVQFDQRAKALDEHRGLAGPGAGHNTRVETPIFNGIKLTSREIRHPRLRRSSPACAVQCDRPD